MGEKLGRSYIRYCSDKCRMNKTNSMNGLIWFRNDLCTIDNHSLYNACRENEKVIGIYCLDPRHFETTQYGFKKTEKFRTQFLLETLAELQQNLAEKEYLVISLLRLIPNN